MKCHYERCQEPADPNWPYFRAMMPLCQEHATAWHEMVPIPDTRNPDQMAEHEKLADNIYQAFKHIRSDYEWDKWAPERRPELS